MTNQTQHSHAPVSTFRSDAELAAVNFTAGLLADIDARAIGPDGDHPAWDSVYGYGVTTYESVSVLIAGNGPHAEAIFVFKVGADHQEIPGHAPLDHAYVLYTGSKGTATVALDDWHAHALAVALCPGVLAGNAPGNVGRAYLVNRTQLRKAST